MIQPYISGYCPALGFFLFALDGSFLAALVKEHSVLGIKGLEIVILRIILTLFRIERIYNVLLDKRIAVEDDHKSHKAQRLHGHKDKRQRTYHRSDNDYRCDKEQDKQCDYILFKPETGKEKGIFDDILE